MSENISSNVVKEDAINDVPAEPVIPLPNLIQIKIKSQFSEKLISVDENSSIAELKAIVCSKFGCSSQQVVLMWEGAVVQDENTLAHLNVVNNSRLHVVINQPLQNDLSGFSDFARLGVGQIDFIQLQKDMQKRLNSNPELLRQLVGTPLVQQLMSNPSVVTQLISQVPQANNMLQKNPDLAEMLSNKETMKISLKVAEDPALLQELIDNLTQDQNSTKSSTKDVNNSAEESHEDLSAELPSTHALLRLMAQDSQSIHTMLQAPYLSSILEHMKLNPAWANQLIMENSLLSKNKPLQQQMINLLPAFLQQMENADVVSMMEKPQALQAMLRIQRGLHVLHQHVPNIRKTTGLAYLSSDGGIEDVKKNEAALEENEVEKALVNNEEITELKLTSATNLIMSEIVNHMAGNKLKRPLDERYTEELDLMQEMGFAQQDSNLEILKKHFGNVDRAVSELLS